MKSSRNWLILLAATAAAGTFAIQSALHKGEPSSAPPLTITSTIVARTETPSALPPYEQCGYMWAYYDIPQLTEKLDASVHALDSSASARTQAFGEDCVYNDGHKDFSAMETDYYVSSPTADLTNQEVMGHWIMQVMLEVLQLPSEEIQGPRPGFVEFTFTKSDKEQIILRIPLEQYETVTKDKTAIEVFRYFYIPPSSPT